MVPLAAHMHLIQQDSIVRHGLGLQGVIHIVHDIGHLPLAPIPGQVPVVQDHHGQAPILDLMLNLALNPKGLQKVVVLVGQDVLALHHLMLS